MSAAFAVEGRIGIGGGDAVLMKLWLESKLLVWQILLEVVEGMEFSMGSLEPIALGACFGTEGLSEAASKKAKDCS